MKVKSFIIITLGLLISSLAFNIFLLPYHIVVGGISGISMLLNHLLGINSALSILVIFMFLYIIGCIFLNKENMVKTFIVSLLFPLFIYLTSLFIIKIDLSIDNRFLAGIMGGVTFGFGLGLVYHEGYNTGGMDIIVELLNKYFHFNDIYTKLVIDSLIAIIGSFIFGFETLIYSLITIYIYTSLIDKVVLGIVGSKAFNIITTKPDEVKKYIIDELHHGVTILNGKGAYTGDKKSILFAVIPKRDYYKLKDALKKIDNNAFFVVSNSYEVGGGK